ncbi:alpha/beta hydrolase, partial [Globicatella sulfidifaciens]
MKKFLKILGIIFVGLMLTIILGYYNFRYTAEDVVVKNNMTQDEYGWFVDVPNEQATIIMYQGALVDAKAYLPLAASIAEKGFDIYIMDSWFDLPIFGINQAQNIIDREQLQNVILMGHSLGGVVGSQVALSNSNIEGVVLLASYPAEGTDLSNSTMKVL